VVANAANAGDVGNLRCSCRVGCRKALSCFPGGRCLSYFLFSGRFKVCNFSVCPTFCLVRGLRLFRLRRSCQEGVGKLFLTFLEEVSESFRHSVLRVLEVFRLFRFGRVGNAATAGVVRNLRRSSRGGCWKYFSGLRCLFDVLCCRGFPAKASFKCRTISIFSTPPFQLLIPPDPMHHAKIFKEQPRRRTFWELVPRTKWYKAFPRPS